MQDYILLFHVEIFPRLHQLLKILNKDIRTVTDGFAHLQIWIVMNVLTNNSTLVAYLSAATVYVQRWLVSWCHVVSINQSALRIDFIMVGRKAIRKCPWENP